MTCTLLNMTGFNIATILNKKDRTLPKLLLFWSQDIENYIGINKKWYNKLFDNKKLFDNSVIKQNMTSIDNVS